MCLDRRSSSRAFSELAKPMEHQRGAAEGPLNTHTHVHAPTQTGTLLRGFVLHQRMRARRPERKRRSENQLGLSCSSHTRLMQRKQLTNTHTHTHKLTWTVCTQEPIVMHSRIQDDLHHGGLMCSDTAFYSLQRR